MVHVTAIDGKQEKKGVIKQFVNILLVSIFVIIGGYQLTKIGLPFYQIALIEMIAIAIIFTVLNFVSDKPVD